MLVIIKENYQSDQYTRKLPSSMKQEWKSICDMDMHTQMFLQMVSCFNLENMMDLIEKKVGLSGKQTQRKKLKSLLQTLKGMHEIP